MDPQQLVETSRFYSRCKKCNIEKNFRGWVPPPFGIPKVKINKMTMMTLIHDEDDDGWVRVAMMTMIVNFLVFQ